MILSTYIFGPFGGGEDIQQTRVDLIEGARLVSDENWILRLTQNLSDGSFTFLFFSFDESGGYHQTKMGTSTNR